jgi:putative multiple sugar transport system substrate-binding protein
MPGASVVYSNEDVAVEKTNVETLIANGVKVIVICAQDGKTAAAEVDEANAQGIKVIAYDRLIMNTANLTAYATFDSLKVGAAQAQYLVDNATGTGNNLYLYAGAVSDNNSFLFFQGAWSVLQPKIADGTFVIQNSDKAVGLKDTLDLTHAQMADILGQITTDWKQPTALTLAQANLGAASAAQKGKVYVLAPNDDTSRTISDAFSADADVSAVFSTGQDFTQASAQYILDGKQGMTVWKSDKTLVEQTKAVVDSILNGTGDSPVLTTTYDNGAKQVPSTAADIVTVTKDNVKDVIGESGLYTVDANNKVQPA